MKRSRSPGEMLQNFDGIPTKIPIPIRQKSPATPRTYTSQPNHENDTFYLLKEINVEKTQVTGEQNLINHFGLQHSYDKFSTKKVKEQLSAFLPGLPGRIDTPGVQDNSSLQSVIEKPPIGGKPLIPLTGPMLSGFKLHPGPVPDHLKWLHSQPPKKQKRKKQKRDFGPPEADPGVGGGSEAGGDSSDRGKKRKDNKKKGKKDKKKKKIHIYDKYVELILEKHHKTQLSS
ncbi:putative mediator of RNA polymerase II transcription subunit 19 [Apostichopus japonicus]|uniref:Mediator of RNA polymerase II transcription subunit 19 n=1 Tax=Stichopus japonicus TaxID=307972 RepID=A0A2G8KQ67_STIJA|nr:putative mediator of RNA polymerase II transcription subunit 19 [Apostichopus japonicus]